MQHDYQVAIAALSWENGVICGAGLREGAREILGYLANSEHTAGAILSSYGRDEIMDAASGLGIAKLPQLFWGCETITDELADWLTIKDGKTIYASSDIKEIMAVTGMCNDNIVPVHLLNEGDDVLKAKITHSGVVVPDFNELMKYYGWKLR